MTYFNLRKRVDEPGPEPEEEAEEEQPEELEDEPAEQQPKRRTYGPIATGLLGPGMWIAARFGTGAAWGVHGVAVWAIGYYGGWAAAGIVLLWLLLVGLFTPSEALDRLSGWIENLHVRRLRAAVQAAPGGEREAVRRLLLDLIGEAPGVHLKTVLAHLQKHGQWEGRKVADLRVHLEALGIPVDLKLRVDGTPTRGVRRADLEAPSPPVETPPSPPPSPPV